MVAAEHYEITRVDTDPTRVSGVRPCAAPAADAVPTVRDSRGRKVRVWLGSACSPLSGAARWLGCRRVTCRRVDVGMRVMWTAEAVLADGSMLYADGPDMGAAESALLAVMEGVADAV